MRDANLCPPETAPASDAEAQDAHLSGAACPAPRDIFNDTRSDHFIRSAGASFAGTHLLIDVVGGTGLGDEVRIRQALRDCVTACGATLLHIHTHAFSPQGISGVAVLAESHISVHTWPEIGYGAFDVFMCGGAQPWQAIDVLKSAFVTDDVRVREILRGQGIARAPA
jgi:S-adenosylmethionine decarboxylase